MIKTVANNNLIHAITIGTAERERERASFLNNKNVGVGLDQPVLENQFTYNKNTYKKPTTNQNENHFGVWLFGVEKSRDAPYGA